MFFVTQILIDCYRILYLIYSLACKKMMAALTNRANNYLDLLLEMPRYCCLFKKFLN